MSKLNFSQRMGLESLAKPMQIDDIDIDLKNNLWNFTKICFIEPLMPTIPKQYPHPFEVFCRILWINFFRIPVDNISGGNHYGMLDFIKKSFFDMKWHKIYDFIELLV